MKLGELFVELGVQSGGAFNDLSSFAFKFNQLYDLASKVSDIFDKVFDNRKYAANLRDLSMSTGLGTDQLQAMETAAKKTGSSLDSALGFFNKVRKEHNDWVDSGGKNSGYAQKMLRTFGIGPEELKHVKEPIQLINKMMASLSKMPAEKRWTILSNGDFPLEQYKTYLKLQQIGAQERKNYLNLTKDEIISLARLNDLELEVSTNQSNRWKKLQAHFTNTEIYANYLRFIDDISEAFTKAAVSGDGFFDSIGKGWGGVLDYLSKIKIELPNALDDTGFFTNLINDAVQTLNYGLAALGDTVRFIGYLLNTIVEPVRLVMALVRAYGSTDGNWKDKMAAMWEATKDWGSDFGGRTEKLFTDSFTADLIRKNWQNTGEAPAPVSNTTNNANTQSSYNIVNNVTVESRPEDAARLAADTSYQLSSKFNLDKRTADKQASRALGGPNG